MRIRELQIINFRNIRFLRGEFAPGLNLVYGSNAQGKTNILEAIYLLVTGRSFRTTMDREMIPWIRDGYEATVIRACVDKKSYDERFLLTFSQSEKHVFLNGNPLSRLGELVGRINAVLFTPSDLQLVSGSPGLRRRFLDIEISQVSRPYLHHLQRYDLALRQRNALLKQHQKRPSLKNELVAWDHQLAEHGSELFRARSEMIEKLSRSSAGLYSRISGQREVLRLRYDHSPRQIEAGANPFEGLLSALRNAQDDDIRRGATSVGPHRDDFAFLIDDREARDFGSQGQQRSCVLAVKLAELHIMQQATGEMPLLMLDDLMSELDDSRKRALLEILDPATQVFITATEESLVAPLRMPDAVFQMEDGELLRQE
jgi:DNA replication and repair protein RecF